MVLTLLGVLLLNLSFVLSGAPISLLPSVCVAVIVVIYAIYTLFEWRESRRPRPKTSLLFCTLRKSES